MDKKELEQELLTTSWNTINFLRRHYSGYFDTYPIIIMDKYSTRITNYDSTNEDHIPNNYQIKSLIDATINDYMETHNELNIEELKSTLIKLLLNIFLELQYKISNKNYHINLSDISFTSHVEDQYKLMFLNSNPNIIKDLLISGMTEVIARDIGEKLDIEIIQEFNEEYKFVLESKKLLNDKYDLLIKGDLKQIFDTLGENYKNLYMINCVNHIFKNMSEEDIKKLGLTEDERNMLIINLDIKLPNEEIMKIDKENEKALEKMKTEEVNHVNKGKTQYIKLEDEDEPVFAEIIGNITPKERLDKIKDRNRDVSLKAPELVDEVKKEMITNDDFEDIDKKVVPQTNKLKIDTKTGLLIDEKGNPYTLEDGQITKLGNNGEIERRYNMNIDPNIKDKLIEYGVYEQFIKANPEQQKIILATYSLSDENTKDYNNTKTQEISHQKKLTFGNIDRNGYISSFIIVFSIGVLSGIISAVLLNIAR